MNHVTIEWILYVSTTQQIAILKSTEIWYSTLFACSRPPVIDTTLEPGCQRPGGHTARSRTTIPNEAIAEDRKKCHAVRYMVLDENSQVVKQIQRWNSDGMKSNPTSPLASFLRGGAAKCISRILDGLHSRFPSFIRCTLFFCNEYKIQRCMQFQRFHTKHVKLTFIILQRLVQFSCTIDIKR
jgi:hypothetical protein